MLLHWRLAWTATPRLAAQSAETPPTDYAKQQFAIWSVTRETARSEIAPYPEITAKRGVYEGGLSEHAAANEIGHIANC